jgi:hypothetical protein
MAAKRNRKGQFVKGARRSPRKRAHRRPSKTLSHYRAAIAGLFRRKVKPRRAAKRRRNPKSADIMRALQRRRRVEENRINAFDAYPTQTKKQLRAFAAHTRGLVTAAARRRRTRNPSKGIAASKARRHRARLQQASRRRLNARPLFARSHGAVSKALHRARQVTRGPSRKRRLDLDAAIRRLERAGVVTALSSPAQQRRGTISGGPRAKRLLALQRALHRRTTVNPRRKRKSTMAHALARNSKGRFLKRGRSRRRSATAKVANPRRRRRAAPHRKHRRRHHARRAHNPMGGGLRATSMRSGWEISRRSRSC